MRRYPHCPRCGETTERVVTEGRERDRCPRCQKVLYDNAKPCAGVVLTDDAGRVLLVKRAIEPFKGYWDLPGGFLEADEHPADGARREAFEETGLEVELTDLLGMYVDTYEPERDPLGHHYSLNIFFLARLTGGRFQPNAESTEAAWFAPEALPPMEAIAYVNGRRALADWLARQQGARERFYLAGSAEA